MHHACSVPCHDWSEAIYCAVEPYRIVGKFAGELNLAVWQIDQPTAKLKFANIKSFLCTREGDRASRSKSVGVVFGLQCRIISEILSPMTGVQTFLKKKMMPSFAAAGFNSIYIARSMEAANHSPWSLMVGARAGTKFRAWLDRTQLSAKLKSTNIFVLADWGQSTKFNSHQIFQLYGKLIGDWAILNSPNRQVKTSPKFPTIWYT